MMVSPVLAGLAVGIGVPILLFYVYGVVPVSLCRSGGCGISTSASGGVRFDFDDESELMGVLTSKGQGGEDSRTNPSIGEASLSLGSGCQLEREADRESASFVALAGSILSAAQPSSTQRLEVLADVTCQRLSLSSETASATTSLSDKSVADTEGGSSTIALAGSLLSYRAEGSCGQAGEALSLSSLEEFHLRRAQRHKKYHQMQIIESYFLSIHKFSTSNRRIAFMSAVTRIKSGCNSRTIKSNKHYHSPT